MVAKKVKCDRIFDQENEYALELPHCMWLSKNCTRLTLSITKGSAVNEESVLFIIQNLFPHFRQPQQGETLTFTDSAEISALAHIAN